MRQVAGVRQTCGRRERFRDTGFGVDDLEILRTELHLHAQEHGRRITAPVKPLWGKASGQGSNPMQKWKGETGWVAYFLPSLRRTGDFEHAAQLAVVLLVTVEEHYRANEGFRRECDAALATFADNVRRRRERLGRPARTAPQQSFGSELARVLADREEPLETHRGHFEPAEAEAVA